MAKGLKKTKHASFFLNMFLAYNDGQQNNTGLHGNTTKETFFFHFLGPLSLLSKESFQICQYDYVYYLYIHIAFKFNVSQEITTPGCFHVAQLAHFFVQ